MAITFIGASAAGVISATSVSVTPHGSTQAGDLMLAYVGIANAGDPATIPSGWLRLQESAFASLGRSLHVYMKVATAGDLGAAQTWTRTPAVNWAAGILTFRGTDAIIPINASNIIGTGTGTNWAIRDGMDILAGQSAVMAACMFAANAGVAGAAQAPLTAAPGGSASATSITVCAGYEAITAAIGARSALGSNAAHAASVVYLQEPGVSGDTTPPAIANVTPAPGTPILRTQAVTFDVTDASPGLRRVLPAVHFPGIPNTELVHDGDDFTENYRDRSAREAISGGFRYTILRKDGWPDAPTLIPFAYDQDGNEAA